MSYKERTQKPREHRPREHRARMWRRIPALSAPTVLTRVVLGLGVAALFGGTPSAHAQGSGVLQKGSVSKIEIAVWDPATKSELAQLDLGDTLELEAGQSVLLRLYVPRGHGPGNQRHYLPARFFVGKGQGARLSEVDTAKGTAVLTASRDRRLAEIRYDLGRGIQVTKPYLAKGSFQIEVTSAEVVTGKPTPAEPRPSPELNKARKAVGRLYAGILMREIRPERGDSKVWVDRVHRGGYPELVQVANEIVESEESQVKVPERGFSERDRLLALYEHLLDLERDEVDRYQWRDHLEMMVAGDVTAVVMDIVRSPEYRRVQGYNL